MISALAIFKSALMRAASCKLTVYVVTLPAAENYLIRGRGGSPDNQTIVVGQQACQVWGNGVGNSRIAPTRPTAA
jgi:hypothetical protein